MLPQPQIPLGRWTNSCRLCQEPLGCPLAGKCLISSVVHKDVVIEADRPGMPLSILRGFKPWLPHKTFYFSFYIDLITVGPCLFCWKNICQDKDLPLKKRTYPWPLTPTGHFLFLKFALSFSQNAETNMMIFQHVFFFIPPPLMDLERALLQ